jgi:predicted acylesterase/phospholipase RssA
MKTAASPVGAESDEFKFNVEPREQCDLVMKGGITSGVVYPPAVLKLAERFRFRCIGGTSAGAIAAAVSAAAEFSRERGGFQRLDALRKRLAEPGFLLQLFKPTREAAPAFDVLTELLLQAEPAASSPSPPKWRRVPASLIRVGRSLSTHFPTAAGDGRAIGVVLGALPVMLILLGIWLASSLSGTLSRPSVAISLAVLAGVGMLLGGWTMATIFAGRAFARVFTKHLPERGHFGLCRGYENEDERVVLTTWLSDQIDALAGVEAREDPLTFADLSGKAPADGRPADITLRMVTSNLSHGQPYVFPRDGNVFLFHEAELARFFPERIIRYLKKAGSDGGLPLPPGYLFLPKGDKLPVIFATRLSLSFPILLSAVRLYTIRATAFGQYRRCQKAGQPFTFEPQKHFQENWFSDGGISSNFPIHFFDSWLPSRPTFGINLADVPAEGKTADGHIRMDQFSAVPEIIDAADEDEGSEGEGTLDLEEVFLPHPREGAKGMPQWNRVTGLPGFLMSMFDTARNYRDTMQAMLPSYRERVVQVRLTAKEGGLNLAMAPETIRNIGAKGRRAGEKLAAMDFRQHQWVRFRVLMAYLEKGLHRMRANFPALSHYEELFGHQLSARTGVNGGSWYKPKDDRWCERAISRLTSIVELGTAWEEEFFANDPPRPEASLRVTPPL